MILEHTETVVHENTPNSGIQYLWILGEDGTEKPYGEVKILVTATAPLIHVSLYKPTKTQVKQIKREVFEVMLPLMKRWDFDFIIIPTTRKSFVKRLTDNKAVLAGTVPDSYENELVYVLDLETG